LKAVKEFEKKNKDLQVKHDANEQSWTRLKTDMADKQRKVRDHRSGKNPKVYCSFSMMRVSN
jgi:hypothetical protein